MAWGALLGSAIGAAGQIGGGLLSAQGQSTPPGDVVSSYYNPMTDYALQAAQYDALNQIGWGNLGNIPDVWQQLAGQFQNTPMDAKTRRRAMVALNLIKQDPTLLNDPYGNNFTRDEVFNANKNGAPFGRVVTRGPENSGFWGKKSGQLGDAAAGASVGGTIGGAATAGSYAGPVGAALGAIIGGLASVEKGNNTQPTGLQLKGIGRLDQALQAAGMSFSDLQKKLVEQKEFEDKVARLKAAGLPQLAEQMVIDRARTGAAAASLAAAGADYATTGGSQNPLFQDLIAQDQRGMNRFATRAGLQANFGGISQAAAQKQISDAELDQNLRVLQNALATSGLLQATLAPGTAAAQGAANNTGQFNAAQIAAQQASAANSLRQAGNANAADSIGNAVGSATSTLGTYFSNLAAQQQLGSNNVFEGYNYGNYGPGSTQNQINTGYANGSSLFG